jgi:hypothetical protein
MKYSLGEPTPKQQTLSWFTQSGQVTLPVTNDSDCETRFLIEGADAEGRCSFEFQAPGEAIWLARQIELSVQPGDTASVLVTITPLTRQLVGLVKETHCCTITTTMLGERPARRAVLTRLRGAPLIGPGLLALLTICLVAVAGLILQRFSVNYAPSDFRLVQDNKTKQTARLNSKLNSSAQATAAAAAENSQGQGMAGDLTYEEIFKEVAQAYDLDWRLLAEQAYQESRLDPLAIGVSNEIGLMQILPSTWIEWAPKVGVSDPFDPYSNVLVAAAYLVFLREYFGSLGYTEEYWMVAAYNWGPNNLRQVLEDNGGWAQVPPKTRRYTLDILRATEAGSAYE